MKYSLILGLLLFPILASAKTFTLVDETTKEKFTCTSSAPAPTPDAVPADKPKIEDPDCTSKLTELCNAKSGHASTYCFDLAGKRCKDARGGYFACVKSTQQSCVSSSSGSASYCFDRALRECK